MKKARDTRALAPVDVAQRYTIAEAILYLKISRAAIYKEINARRIRVLKLGKRTFVTGSEIARLSRLVDASGDSETSVPEKPAIRDTTAYRLLDSRIHQALMKDIARQQSLWDIIQKFDGKLQHLTHLVEKLAREPRREMRVTENTAVPHFLRLKDITAQIGLGKTAIYRYMAIGAFPRPRKVGTSSLWVAAEVDDWIAQRTAGVPVEINGREVP